MKETDTAGNEIKQRIWHCPARCESTGGCYVCDPNIQKTPFDEMVDRYPTQKAKIFPEREDWEPTAEEEERFYKKVMKTKIL